MTREKYQCPHCRIIQFPEDAHHDPELARCKTCDKYFRKWAVTRVDGLNGK